MTLTLTGAGPCSPGVANADLLPALVAWWSLDETATGSRADRTANALTLTSNAACDWVSGQVGAAAKFTGTESLTHADAALLNLSGKDWTLAFWFQTTDLSASRFLVGRVGEYSSVTADWEWGLYHRSSGEVYLFVNSAANDLTQLAGPTASAGHWHLAVAWYDTANHVIGVQVDNGTPVTASYSLTVKHNAANPFGVGGNPATAAGATPGYMHRGYLDEVAIWASTAGGGGVLTAGQRAELWNGGAGITYPGATVAGRSYYFSAAGNNGNAGTSPAAPFLSFAALPRLLAKDTYNLNGGDTFAGPLTLAGTSNSTTNGTVTVTSYGTGQAVINAANGDGILIDSINNVTVDGVTVTGSGVAADGTTTTTATSAGVRIMNKNTGAVAGVPDQRRTGVTVKNCAVSGCNLGIDLASYDLTDNSGQVNGWTACSLTDNTVSGCAQTGIRVFGVTAAGARAIDHVTVARNTVHGCPGRGGTHNTGYGVIVEWANFCDVGGAAGALTDGNVVYSNGGSSWSDGSGAIVFYRADDCTARYNEVYDQKDPVGTDGVGVAVDEDCHRVVAEGNYAHDCDGSCFQIFQSAINQTSSCTFRHNVGVNGGRVRTGAGGGFKYSVTAGTGNVIHNNTFFQDKAVTPDGIALSVLATNPTDVTVANNRFILRGSGVDGFQSTGTFTCAGNLYDMTAFRVEWNGSFLSSLAALHTAGGEKVGAVSYGVVATSALVNSGGNGVVHPPTGLTAYDPLAGDAGVDAGLGLLAVFGVSPGTLDFHGNTNAHGAGPDVGAVEYQGA